MYPLICTKFCFPSRCLPANPYSDAGHHPLSGARDGHHATTQRAALPSSTVPRRSPGPPAAGAPAPLIRLRVGVPWGISRVPVHAKEPIDGRISSVRTLPLPRLAGPPGSPQTPGTASKTLKIGHARHGSGLTTAGLLEPAKTLARVRDCPAGARSHVSDGRRTMLRSPHWRPLASTGAGSGVAGFLV